MGLHGGLAPVFYKGMIYGLRLRFDNSNQAIVTSADNCETLNVNGIIYTKVTE